MEYQPNEILEQILRYLSNLNLMVTIRVCKRWQNLIENKICYQEMMPSIEKCIINEDYYHMRSYLNVSPTFEQKNLIEITKNQILMNYYEIKYDNHSKEQSFIEYSRTGNVDVINYLLKIG